MYALVKFVDNTTAVVPLSWLKGDYCYWPNVKDVARLSRAETNPTDDWKLYKISIKSIYGSIKFSIILSALII